MASSSITHLNRSLLSSRLPTLNSTNSIHTTPRVCDSLKNLRRFIIPNVKNAHEAQKIPNKAYDFGFYDYPMSRDPLGIRYPGYWFRKKFVYVKEMEPELMVPDLTGFQLKPYVSYRVQDVACEPLTAENLFRQTYGNLVIDAYVSGERLEISTTKEEIQDAHLRHLQTGSDMFTTSVSEAEKLAGD